MKRLCNSLILLIVLCSISCAETNVQGEDSQLNYEKINSVKLVQDVDEQKAIYVTLNKSEKHFLWTERIELYIQNNKLNPEQRTHLLELRSKLDDDIFAVIDGKGLKDIEESWSAKAFELFGESEIKSLLGSVNNEVISKDRPAKNLKVNGNQCGCHVGSMWSCGACNTGVACLVQNGGCGFLWNSSCNGSCLIGPRPQ